MHDFFFQTWLRVVKICFFRLDRRQLSLRGCSRRETTNKMAQELIGVFLFSDWLKPREAPGPGGAKKTQQGQMTSAI